MVANGRHREGKFDACQVFWMLCWECKTFAFVDYKGFKRRKIGWKIEGELSFLNLSIKTKIVFGCVQLQRPLCLPFHKVRRWTRNRKAGVQLDPFKIICFICLYSNFQHIKTEKDGHSQFFCIQDSWTQVCLQQSCNSTKYSVPYGNISHNRRFVFNIELLLLPQ